MPQMAIYDMSGEKAADMEVPEGLLDLPYNEALVHQAVLAVQAASNRRWGKAKTRSEVGMTSAKWYRQKGLGRARHGARSAPTFVGGGKAHGPIGDQPSHKIPKQMRRKAKFIALSERSREGALTLLEAISLEQISTKAFVEVLRALDVSGNVLMLVSSEEAQNEVLYKSCRNVPGLVVREVPHFNARDVVWAEDVVITKAAMEQLMEGGAESAE